MPVNTAYILLSALIGFQIGVISGLIPGLHVNNFAFILLGLSGVLAEFFPVLYIASAMICASITHSFLDAVPSLILGVPDESMALAALPGHRLVLEGRGKEAVTLSAMGSLLSVSFALLLAAPVTFVMTNIYPFLQRNMALVLIGVVAFILFTEKGGESGVSIDVEGLWRAVRIRLLAVLVLALSGVMGYIVFEFEESVTAVVGDGTLLMPLFIGLFGFPLLLVSAVEDVDIPSQMESEVNLDRKHILMDAFSGGMAGALVGWLPGMSAAVATSVVQSIYPESESVERSMRGFIVSVSGVDTSNAIFALFALYYIGRSRSGVMVALNETGLELSMEYLLWFLLCIVLAAILSFIATIKAADRMFRIVSSLNYKWICTSLLIGLIAMTYLFSGFLGLPVLIASTLIGLIPNYTQVRRVNCMGCLMIPLIHFYLQFQF